MIELPRRTLLKAAGVSLAAAGCQPVEGGPAMPGAYGLSEALTFRIQRFLLRKGQLAREFGPEAISRVFPTINTTNPEDEGYQRSKAAGFADWRLPVSGLVERPSAFSLAELKAMPARTQITLHSCEQGWSAIAAWTGVPLAKVLEAAGLRPEARFVVIRCVDGWWDSYDFFDVFHPQTILAYGMNGRDLPVEHGAPLRLRAERHVGYKSLKYIAGIEAVRSVEGIGAGRGSMVGELGFSWYAGI